MEQIRKFFKHAKLIMPARKIISVEKRLLASIEEVLPQSEYDAGRYLVETWCG